MRIADGVWERLSWIVPSGDELSARLAVPDATDRLLAAIDNAGRRHLLVRLGDSEGHITDRKSRGVQVETRRLRVLGDIERTYVDLACLDPAGHDVLNLMGGELAAGIATGIEAPSDVVQRVIVKWRRFWLSTPFVALSKEEQRGLFAELWFLNYWLIPTLGPAYAIPAWRGPDRARHDFEALDFAVEVKATLSSVGRNHWVHGLDQLEAPETGPLFLFSLGLREERGGANTVPKLIDRIRDYISTEDESAAFERVLLAARVTSVSKDEDELRWRIADERLYRVADAFPRLTRASFRAGVPTGVGQVNYTIDLAGSAECVICETAEEFKALMGRRSL